MAAKKVNRKCRVKKDIEAGIAHIHPTLNSTTIMITDTRGNALAWLSASSLGFKGSKKPIPFVARMTAETATKVTMEHGLKTVEVTVKGPGLGREATIHSSQATGLEVTVIHDVIPVPHSGARPPECRRV